MVQRDPSHPLRMTGKNSLRMTGKNSLRMTGKNSLRMTGKSPLRMTATSLGVTLVALLTVTALFSTCSTGDGGGDSGGGSADATALSGSWQTACTPDPGKPGYAFLDRRTFDGTDFSTEFSSYADTACTELVMAQAQAGTFTIGEAVGDADGVTPQQLDIVIGTVYVTLHTEALVQAYNDSDFCGGGWELGAKRQITKRDCAGDNSGDDDPGKDHIFEIFGIQDDNLYFGAKDAAHSGRRASSRPASLDLGKPYAK